MKKLLAIFLCAVLLLSACAFAEGKELTLSNIQIDANGNPIDLSGIDLRLSYAKDGESSDARLAIDGNGAELANLTVSLQGDELLLAATGLSKVYALTLDDAAGEQEEQDGIAFTEQDLNDFLAVLNAWLADFEASMVPAGTEEIDGATYQNYSISISAEQLDTAFFGFCDILDRQSAIRAAVQKELGVDSLRALQEASGIAMSVEGTLSIGEQDASAEVIYTVNDPELEEPEHIGMDIIITAIEDETTAGKGVDVSICLYDADDAQSDDELDIGLTITLDGETEAFTGMDGYVLLFEDGAEKGAYFGVYSPAVQGSGLWQVSLMSYDETTAIDVAFGKTEELDGVYAAVTADGSVLEFYYDAGKAGLSLYSGEEYYSAAADVTISDTDGSWLALDGANAVDALNMTDAQMQSLETELLATLLRLASGLAASNETVAALLGGLMG